MDISPLVNKRVAFRYCGVNLRFDLSHGLFSSFDIDAGTKLLLKALAAKGRMEEAGTLLDAGCGAGTICVALSAAYPALRAAARDRDALALEFTKANAGLNGVGQRVSAEGGLLLDSGGPLRYDRIVSNLPAKAGAGALEDFLRRAPSFLSPGGMAGIVIVHTLGDFARRTILASGHAMVHEEKARDYAVFLFGPGHESTAGRGAEGLSLEDALSPYSRGTVRFSLRGTEFSLGTVFGLPDFDTAGNEIDLAARFLESDRAGDFAARLSGRSLVWAPGQGHIPAWFAARFGAKDMVLAGRDILSLEASKRSAAAAVPGTAASILHAAEPSVLASGPFDAIAAFPESVPGYDWCAAACAAFREALAPGGMLLMVGRSGELSALDKRRPEGLRSRGDRREKGNRAILYERVS